MVNRIVRVRVGGVVKLGPLYGVTVRGFGRDFVGVTVGTIERLGVGRSDAVVVPLSEGAIERLGVGRSDAVEERLLDGTRDLVSENVLDQVMVAVGGGVIVGDCVNVGVPVARPQVLVLMLTAPVLPAAPLDVMP